jgi:hypothetical protein
VAGRLLAAGADADAREANGGSPLHFAAGAGSAPIVRALLDAGADPAARTRVGWTPLEWAAVGGDSEAVRLLLERGPAPASVDLAQILAAMDGHDAVVALLAGARGSRTPDRSLWKPVTATAPGRLAFPADHPDIYRPLFRTVARWDGRDALVFVRYPGGAAPDGTPFEVFAFDEALRLTSRGRALGPPDAFPYSLVEVRSESPRLPEVLRGEPLAGIAFWLATNRHMPGRPVALHVAGPVPPGPLTNVAVVRRVKWRDQEAFGDFTDLDHARTTWAELGPSPHPN